MQPEFTSLLMPISPENPVGDDMEYDPLFDTIRQARESDPDDLPDDAWTISEPRKADWRKVNTLSEKALTAQSKDLQLASWYVESHCHLTGLAGLQVGVEFLSEFLTRYWFQCWPALEEGMSLRRSKLLRLDRDISQHLYSLPLLQRQPSTTLSHWRQVLAFEHAQHAHPNARDADDTFSMAHFDKQAAQFSSIEISQQAERVEQLLNALDQLESRYISLSQDNEGEPFTQTRQMLLETIDFLQRLSQRTIPQADDRLLLPEMADVPTEAAETPSPRSNAPVMSRELAISQMLSLAAWFRQSEPSSPVPFLLERAARWADMTLEDWLNEMITDSGSIRDIHHVLTGVEPQ